MVYWYHYGAGYIHGAGGDGMKTQGRMSLWEIFLTSAKIGLMSYGGGNTTIVLFHKEYVEKRGLIDDEEFTHMIGPSIFVPGPSGLNIAYASGLEAHGLAGAIVSMLGVMLPPLLMVIPLWILLKISSEIPGLSGLKLGLKVVGGTMALYAALVVFEKILAEKGAVKWASIVFGLFLLTLLAMGINIIIVVVISVILAPFMGIFIKTSQ